MSVTLPPDRRSHFSVDVDASTGVIHAAGVLDTTTVNTVRECMAFATNKKRRTIEIDLSGIHCISEAAVRLLQNAVAAAGETGVSVRILTTAGCPAERAMSMIGTLTPSRTAAAPPRLPSPAGERHLRSVPTGP